MSPRVAAAQFGDLWVWGGAGERMRWYREVAENAKPAKMLLARRLASSVPLAAPEADLWAEHARLTAQYERLWAQAKGGGADLAAAHAGAPSLVELSAELARRMLAHCNFCRWNCGVDRLSGTKHGTCQLASTSRVGTFFHHRGEELVFRGTQGSGTIFFTSCNLRCQFCQNGDISHDKDNGLEVSADELAAMAWQLRAEGCHNINFVGGEPTVHLHTVLGAVARLAGGAPPAAQEARAAQRAKADASIHFTRHQGAAAWHGQFNVPLLWNSNFFMSPEALRLLRPLFDVWLPDFKFGNNKCAVTLARTPWYFETVAANHQAVYDWGEGMVIRHLVMPGHLDCCTAPVLRWIAAHTPEALVNVMDQYHPDFACDPWSDQFDERMRPMARRPSDEEVLRAYAMADELGLAWREVTLEKTILGLTPRP